MTTHPDLAELLAHQRAAFRAAAAPTSRERKADLRRLEAAIIRRRTDLVSAASADFGHRSSHETLIADINPSVQSIRYLMRHLVGWMRPEPRTAQFPFYPARLQVVRQPLGVVGIISPWNYPIYLALAPLATAIAAGDRVMLKPSEHTPATSSVLAGLVREVFPADQATVVPGGADVGAAFSGLPFDHLFFTGSGAVARDVLRAASANLVPVTLELGGKSPVIVDRGYSLELAAAAVARGKLFNAGQTCVAPDHVMVPAEAVDRFAELVAGAMVRLYPSLADNPDYTSIVNDRHYERLVALVDDARRRGARVIEVGPANERLRAGASRKMVPTLLCDVSDDMRVMQEEIFGPLLPIVPYGDVDEAIARVERGPRPLALYLFGNDTPARRAILARTTSGGVCINDTQLQVLQDDLPFGGVGASGMGAYHGREGFLTMSHSRAVMHQPRSNLPSLLRPPYGRLADRLIDFLLQ